MRRIQVQRLYRSRLPHAIITLILVATSCLLTLGSVNKALSDEKQDAPNIVLILVDDK